jgi:hypothetical protein
MDRITLATALKLELPGHTALIASGGQFELAGEWYEAEPDALVGVPESFDAGEEGVGDTAPSIEITFITPPEDEVPSADLNTMALANSRLRIWVVEIDEGTGLVVGDGDQLCDMMLDYPRLSFEEDGRRLILAFVPTADRLFAINIGNCLSPSFHESIWPGEKGLANASAVSRSVAWGAASAPRGSSTGGVVSGGGGDGGGNQLPAPIE